MRDVIDTIGLNAGKVWTTLQRKGPLTSSNLLKNMKLPENNLYLSIGWLARENKICKRGTKYQLGETNLTNDIGNNAGKVWNTLNEKQDIDVSTIAELSQIKMKDAYAALGWLARENKIQASTGREIKYKLK